MRCTPEAIEKFQEKEILFASGKAANAGGVATSGLEMAQISMKINWSKADEDDRLHHIMTNIHENCVRHGKNPEGYVDYVKGAYIAGFLKVADAQVDQGLL